MDIASLKDLVMAAAAASATTLTVDNPKPVEDNRTIVLPRRKNQRKDFPKIVVSEIHKQDLVWVPSDSEIDSDREKRQSFIEKLESSDFFQEEFKMTSYFSKVMEPESKIPVVISPTTLTVDNPKPARRSNQRKDFQKIVVTEIHKQDLVWAPSETEIVSDREVKLLQKMQSCIEKLESSDYFREFINQMQSLEMSSYFSKVMELESKIPVVIYGIGSIESKEPPCLQLGLVILLKKSFNWIGDIEVFDPIISFTESRILMGLGCSVLSINEQGRRQVSKPTLFFMPHCNAQLYDNLLQTNWKTDSLNKIVLFGNSFEEYERIRAFTQNPAYSDMQNHISAIKKFTKEFAIDTVSVYYFRAFSTLSWHFFSLASEVNLEPAGPELKEYLFLF